MQKYFDFLDHQINDMLRSDIGFSTCPAAEIYPLQGHVLEGFKSRYDLLIQFQEITESIFRAALKNEADPFLASLIINELPDSFGWSWHRELHQNAENLEKRILPAFFRTDEVIPGKISEIQCPGSLWCQYEQLHSFYEHFSQDFQGKSQFPRSMSREFARQLRSYLPTEPAVHHLLDNASVPAGMRFFLQRTREQGIKYYGYDKDVSAYDCNFIRAHAFHGLMSDNYSKNRFQAWKKGQLAYDLPPSILFDEKISLIFPFWEKTRHMYSDEIRDIFPYTTLITPESIALEDGRILNIDEFFDLPRSQREYFVKYAGCDLDNNWGSKGVYSAKALTRDSARQLKTWIQKGYEKHNYWILQRGYSDKESVAYLDRSKGYQEMEATAKFSGFYGPSGLMGILSMHRPFYKVHGSSETIVSIC